MLLLLSDSTTWMRSRMNLPSLYFWDSSEAASCGPQQHQAQGEYIRYVISTGTCISGASAHGEPAGPLLLLLLLQAVL